MADKLRKLKDEAAKLVGKNKLEKALQVYQEILEIEPDDLQTRLKAGDAYKKIEDNENAINSYQLVAKGYAEDGLLLKAIAVCKLILELDDNHRETQVLLADLYAKKSGRSKTSMANLASASTAISAASSEDEDIIIDVEEAAPEQEKELPTIPLFSDLSKNAFIQLMEKMTMRQFEVGEYIIREGDVGDSFFILSQGKVKVTKLTETGEDFVLAHLEDGAFFGEMALLSDSPRTASIIADDVTLAFEVSKDVLDEVISNYVSVKHVLIRFYKQRLLANLLATSPIFRPLAPPQRKALIEKFKSREVAPATELLTQGAKGDGLYMLLSGQVKVTKTVDGKTKLLAKLKEGDVFGEMSLVSNDEVSATVTTTKTSIVLRLPRRSFNEAASTMPQLLAHISDLSEERKRTTDAIVRGEMEYRDDGLVLV